MPDLTKPSLTWTLTWDADWVTAVAFLGSSRRVAAGNNLGQIVLWELPEGTGGEAPKPLVRFDGHTNVISRLAWHPDGKHLASSGRDTTVRVWDTSAGKLVAEVGKGRGGQFKDWICAVSWSADGNRIAAADVAGAVQVWSFPT